MDGYFILGKWLTEVFLIPGAGWREVAYEGGMVERDRKMNEADTTQTCLQSWKSVLHGVKVSSSCLKESILFVSLSPVSRSFGKRLGESRIKFQVKQWMTGRVDSYSRACCPISTWREIVRSPEGSRNRSENGLCVCVWGGVLNVSNLTFEHEMCCWNSLYVFGIGD